jgi:hypothetical protein
MTCRDIINKELKRLGADGIMNNRFPCEGCNIASIEEGEACIYIDECIPAKLVNGKWVPVEVEDKEYCEYTYKDYEYSSGKCRAETSCGISWYGEIELLHNFKHCPECSKKIREVK